MLMNGGEIVSVMAGRREEVVSKGVQVRSARSG